MKPVRTPLGWAYRGPAQRALTDVPGVKLQAGYHYGAPDMLGIVNAHDPTAKLTLPDPDPLPDTWDRLRPYQQEFVRFVRFFGAGLATFDTGLGKSAGALSALKHLERVLIVAPSGGGALLRMWVDEIERWDPGASSEIVGPGVKVAKLQSKFTICSQDGLNKVLDAAPARLAFFGGLIVDEAHNFKSWDSKRTRLLKEILKRHASKPLLKCFLTATPVGKDVFDLHTQVDMLWPGAWGRAVGPGSFRSRYFELETVTWKGGSAVKIVGLRSDTERELRLRVSGLGVRATKQEWAHLLPPFTLSVRWLDAPAKLRAKPWMCDSEAEVAEALSDDRLLDAKVDGTLDLLADRLENPNLKRFVIVTYHRKVARAIHDRLNGRLGNTWTITHIDGETPHRYDVIERARTHDRSLLICTMDSIMQGLNNLIYWTDGIVVELYYRPLNVIQMLGRFWRLTSTSPVMFEILLCRGTIDEPVYHVFAKRTSEMNRILTAGGVEAELGEVVQSGAVSVLDEMRDWLQAQAEKAGHTPARKNTYEMED